MRGTLLLVALASLSVAPACTSSADRPGEGGSDPFTTVSATTGTGLATSGGTGSSTTSSSSSTSGTSSSTTASTGTGATSSSTGTGGNVEPLLPYCGCITDNLSSAGLCRSCWQAALASPDGACADIVAACGPGCTTFINALDTSCTTDVATPACLQMAVGNNAAQIDDFEALLGCLCMCQDCDSSACM